MDGKQEGGSRDRRRRRRTRGMCESGSKEEEDEETSWRHSGGHQRRWSMVGLPVAVFLHNRFSGSPLSFLFFFPLRPSSSPLRRRSLLAAAGLSRFPPQEAPRLLRHCLYLPTSVTCTPPRARSARGGLYLNNIHELRYTRQIYCPGTRGFCEDLRTHPSPCMPPFLAFLGPRTPLPSFFSSLRSPSVSGWFLLVLIDERNLTIENRVWRNFMERT